MAHSDMVHRKEAHLQERLDSKVRCRTCERQCLLVEGGTGWCRTRMHEGGKLYTLTYGSISALSANPIEKKPFYHFYPGSRALTAGSWSCNFGCPWCQNEAISKTVPHDPPRSMSPKQFVEETQRTRCQGTSISFNEPTLSLEWSLDVFEHAIMVGLYNTYVTNGYMTAEALSLLRSAGLHAMNVDIKGDSEAVRKYCKGIDVAHVWERCLEARAMNIHLEITTLVIPGVNDDEATLHDIATRIATDLGHDTPWHLSRYHPAHHFTARATPVSALEHAWMIGKNAGLDYVYIGNVPSHPFSDTTCPECRKALVLRVGFDIVKNLMEDGHCPHCGRTIAGRGLNWQEE